MTEENSLVLPQVKENYEHLTAILIISALFVFVMTFIFRIAGYAYNHTTGEFEFTRGAVDLAITGVFYRDGVWFLENEWLFKFMNDNDKNFLIVLAAISLLMMAYGFSKKERKIWVRYGFFIIISTALIAGLFVNALFKEMWGRWRPRHTEFFGGEHNFYPVWDPAWKLEPEAIGEGVSFPSGHVSVTTSYLALFFAFKHPEFIAHYMGDYKTWKLKFAKGMKWLGLTIYIVGSVLMAISRIVVGAHFTSDTFWTMTFQFFLTVFIYYVIFRMPKYEQKLVDQYQVKNK